ncbi:peptidyl-prolyl cis-trans isomerase [Fulvivirga sp. M361]|uniref:peptidyl-prolyl cis-trans isomerase n=1 Tax=Fulvivirga sp. M361 TaxID=2594266 RepID=UPI00117B48A2|nr:peptidyl-prolyl cis-trans isomerase [Fulvivirga sp. M361]TRX61248.1 peptidyl-prolyl cis-trans isomerase [Fulvivirga sp. M361]
MSALNKISVLGILALSLLSGCDLIKMKETVDQEVEDRQSVARVGDQYLYIDDLEGIAYEGMALEDSTERTRAFINNWIRKQLLIQEASTRIEFDEAEIERKILDYRYSLMGYEYQSYYISENLDREVSDEEIESYYEENIDNFILKQNIIRAKFVKLPNGAPRIKKVRSLLYSVSDKDHEELNAYCLSFATAYELNDSIWMTFDEVVKNSPLAEIPNKVQFLRKNKYVETEDDLYKYFLKIEEYRISDNISPLEFVTEDIRNIIINKRKVELAKELEENIYERASKNNQFEIYN